MNNLAPIVLFVYNRPYHTKQTLEALKQNRLSTDSMLYIYADGSKKSANEKDLEAIKEVREIIKSKQWCKEVFIIESNTNKGLAKSIQTGVTGVIKEHGKAIVMEDDLLTSPAFLTYMNKSLDYYIDRKSVFSISGYSLPENKLKIPSDYEYDVYVSLRNSSWGWATWKDRWEQVDWKVKDYSNMLENINYQQAFNRGGEDLFPMLKSQQNGKLNIWSIQFTMAHFVNHAVSIVPTLSYVDNLGLDGSGENCGRNRGLKNNILNTNEELKFLDILYEDNRIINAFYSSYYPKKRPLWKKIINRISRIVLKRNIFIIKKKVYV